MTSHLAASVLAVRIARVRAALLRLASPGGKPVDDDAAARATLDTLVSAGAPDALLARRVGLSADALDFLWTAVALEADPRLLVLAQQVAGPEVRKGATLALHVAAFDLDEARGRRLAAELARHAAAAPARLLIPARDGDLLPGVPFVVPARVRAFLAGEDDLEPLVARFGGLVGVEPDPILDDEQRRAEAGLVAALDQEGVHLVVVAGPEGCGRSAAVARAAAALGRAVVELDLARCDARIVPLDDVVAAWWRELTLRDAVGLLANLDRLAEPDRRRLAALLERVQVPLAATTGAHHEDLGLRRPAVRVAYPLPDANARRELWRRATRGASRVDLDLLARRYALGAAGVARAAQAARLASDDTPLTTATVVAGVRASVSERLGDLAIPLPVRQSWDDLVLAADTEAEVRALIARVRHAHLVYDVWGFGRAAARGQGVAAILSGPPGTGKTMVAGLIARELELDLLQVDLSRVVSKWIGETEKQLAAVFDAAEAGHALLLFDEADSLFAKRTAEVKGAVDRYANLEVNYLLTRIESFGGVTVLTTNLDTAIDPAVKRRLAAHIVFNAPEADERELLWRRMLPASAPISGPLDFRGLGARFPKMTGAHIRNAVLGAAFQAAAAGTPLSQDLFLRAAHAEYQAMGRVLSAVKGAA